MLTGKIFYETPLGIIEVRASARGISGVKFVEQAGIEIDPEQDLLQQCIEQLEEYFAGERLLFNLMLDPSEGTNFQQHVWRSLRDIPYAQTRTYLDVAKTLGSPAAVRAVGQACSRNPLWLLNPCHRVISASGELTGYAGGLNRKRWLIEHERGVLFGKQTLLF